MRTAADLLALGLFVFSGARAGLVESNRLGARVQSDDSPDSAAIVPRATDTPMSPAKLYAPSCVANCMTGISEAACSYSAFDTFSSCIQTGCQNDVNNAYWYLIASMNMTFTPVPNRDCSMDDDDDAPSIPLNYTCANSPYAFNGIKPKGLLAGENSGDGCWVYVYDSPNCYSTTGNGTRLDGMAQDECFEMSGRSVSVACKSVGHAAEAYLQALCGENSEDVNRIPPLNPSSSPKKYETSGAEGPRSTAALVYLALAVTALTLGAVM